MYFSSIACQRLERQVDRAQVVDAPRETPPRAIAEKRAKVSSCGDSRSVSTAWNAAILPEIRSSWRLASFDLTSFRSGREVGDLRLALRGHLLANLRQVGAGDAVVAEEIVDGERDAGRTAGHAPPRPAAAASPRPTSAPMPPSTPSTAG